MKNTKSKVMLPELVLAALFCTIITLTRMTSIFLPIRCIMGFIIIATIYLGPFMGVIIGIVSVLVSDFFVGTGSWTPFQVLAAVLIALLAGVVFKNKKMIENKWALVMCSILSVMIYSLVMIVHSYLRSGGTFWAVVVSHYTVTLWREISRYVSTLIVVFFFTQPIGKMIKKSIG